MKATGELLKNLREKKGLSIQEVALALKLNAKVIRAIEEGDLPNLPQKTFLRGFVQSYAQYLRADVPEVMSSLQRELDPSRPNSNMPPPEENSSAAAKTKEPSTPHTNRPLFPEDKMEQLRTAKRTGLKGLLVTIMLVTLVLLIVATRHLVEKYQSESTAADLPDIEPIQELARNDQEGSDPASLPVPLLPTKTAIDGLSVDLENKNHVVPVVTSNDSLKSQRSTMDTTTPPPKSTAGEERPSAQTKYVELIIEASDSVEMTIKRQNKEDEKIVLKPEQIHRIRLPSGFNLSFSNGGVVNLTHNGKDIGIPGQPGQPITLKY